MNLTPQQVRDLAECERLMDDGKIAWVRLHDHRVSVSAAAMVEFGLRQGQSINDQIFLSLCQFNVADLTAQIAVKKAQESVAATRKE